MAISIIYPAVDRGAPPAPFPTLTDRCSSIIILSTQPWTEAHHLAHYKWKLCCHLLRLSYLYWLLDVLLAFYYPHSREYGRTPAHLLRIINGNFVVIFYISVIYTDWSMFFQHSTTHKLSTGALLRIINGKKLSSSTSQLCILIDRCSSSILLAAYITSP